MGKWDAQPNIGTYDIKTGRWRPATDAEQAAGLAERKRRNRQSLNEFIKGSVLGTAAVVGAGYGLSALTAGGAAAPAATSGSFGTVNGLPVVPYAAPVAASGPGSAMSIPWWNIGSKAVDTLFGIYSNRQQNKADQRATDYMRTRDAEALAYERELEAQRRLEWQQEQAERKRQWDAEQKFEAEKWAALEEERLHQRALDDAREARQAPYRAASLSALNNLPNMWSSGGTSPGLGSLGSYRGGGQ